MGTVSKFFYVTAIWRLSHVMYCEMCCRLSVANYIGDCVVEYVADCMLGSVQNCVKDCV